MEWFIFWIGVNAIIGYAIGKAKNNVGASVALSILLGPIGWLIALATRGRMRVCPFCAESIKPEARVCRYCGRDLPAVSQRQTATSFLPESPGAKIAVGILLLLIVLIVVLVINASQ